MPRVDAAVQCKSPTRSGSEYHQITAGQLCRAGRFLASQFTGALLGLRRWRNDTHSSLPSEIVIGQGKRGFLHMMPVRLFLSPSDSPVAASGAFDTTLVRSYRLASQPFDSARGCCSTMPLGSKIWAAWTANEMAKGPRTGSS